MGTPIGIAIPGIFCTQCFGVGQRFQYQTTPKYLILEFANIEKSQFWVPGDGEPMNGRHTLRQDPASPCVWFKRYSTPSLVFFRWSLNRTRVLAVNVEGKIVFDLRGTGACGIDLINGVVFSFLGGTCKVSWTQ